MRERRGISYRWPKAYEEWPDGFLGGNGYTGIIVFGNPLEETVIFNHRLFHIAATRSRSFLTVSKEDRTAIRRACAAGDFQRANELADRTHGWKDGGEGNKHPGYEMKIRMPEDGKIEKYARVCDYCTGEIAVGWEDNRGKWNRFVFVSRKDDVIVQRITAPAGRAVSCELEVGIEKGMHFPDGMTFESSIGLRWICMRGIYPEPDKTGGAGYEGVTCVLVSGKNAAVVKEKDALRINGAREVLLLTKIAHYMHECRQEWEKERLQSELEEILRTYRYAGDTGSLYEEMLEQHTMIHRELYDRVTLDLCAAKKDRDKPNEKLLKEQRETAVLLPALYERLFDAGRYHFLCSSGAFGAPDLLGIWTGSCNVGWNGFYHLDANLNLQISGAVIGNMPELMEGYFYLNECWAEDFRTNAQKLLGCRGLLAGGNTPGASSGLISALNFAYPYHYATGEEAWLLYPFWEYFQVTGDLNFLKNRLYPLLYEMGLFYEDFLAETYHAGKYIFAGSVSPENQPKGLGLSLVNNAAFDIAGARFALTTLLEVCSLLGMEKKNRQEMQRWQSILDKLPDYRINEDGALAEWAWEGLKDQYNHRHSSGLIGVWPYHEITPEKDAILCEAARIALHKRDQYTYEDAGHGLLHAALIAACLKETDSLTRKLLRLGREDFYFTGLATAHYPDHRVFCTDVAHTLPAILMEMLVYSEEHVLELLPALPACLPKGEICGMRGRNRITVEKMAWDVKRGEVSCVLTSAVDQSICLILRRGIAKIVTRVNVAASPLGEIAREIFLEAGKAAALKICF